MLERRERGEEQRQRRRGHQPARAPALRLAQCLHGAAERAPGAPRPGLARLVDQRSAGSASRSRCCQAARSAAVIVSIAWDAWLAGARSKQTAPKGSPSWPSGTVATAPPTRRCHSRWVLGSRLRRRSPAQAG
ncbi:MAG: hypothetical protein IPM15_19730 [Betaproteobacteria bacterium]|nr:hypothetical protein [Betaproteobacteria bacterium]